MTSAADVRARALTPDSALACLFGDIARELGIATEVSSRAGDIPAQLTREKYEALLIDFDRIHDAAPAIAALRTNASNRNAVIFAIATQQSHRQVALDRGANFVLGRPLDSKALRRTLYAAYNAMTQERRRYFRCTVELPVFLTRADGSHLVARTGNVSGNGLSIYASISFELGERVGITLDLQNGGPPVLARGVVVWDDKHGKTGISFHCVRPELQGILSAWLDSQFTKMREHATHELQKAHAATQGADG